VWQAQVDAVRSGVMAALRDIRAGTVDELELDKLQNFCLFALALMQAEGPKKWALAKVNAELMSMMKGGDNEGKQTVGRKSSRSPA